MPAMAEALESRWAELPVCLRARHLGWFHVPRICGTNARDLDQDGLRASPREVIASTGLGVDAAGRKGLLGRQSHLWQRGRWRRLRLLPDLLSRDEAAE